MGHRLGAKGRFCFFDPHSGLAHSGCSCHLLCREDTKTPSGLGLISQGALAMN